MDFAGQAPLVSVSLPNHLKGQCFFCGGPGPLTDEHIISKTVRKQIPVVTKVKRLIGTQPSGKELKALHVVLRDAVCGPCNNIWMSQLETDVVAILGPHFANPSIIQLDPSQRERLATWATKVAMLLCAYDVSLGEGAFIPMDVVRWLGEHHSPPPKTKVWMGGVLSENTVVHYSRTAAIKTREEPQETMASAITFSVGYVLFHVTARQFSTAQEERSGRPFPPIEPPPKFHQALIEIWPGSVEGLIRWPPKIVFHPWQMNDLGGWPLYLSQPTAEGYGWTPFPLPGVMTSPPQARPPNRKARRAVKKGRGKHA